RHVTVDTPVELFQNIAGPAIGFANQHEIGVQHVVDHAAESDKCGVVAEPDVLSDLTARMTFQRFADFPSCRSGHDGAGDAHNVIFVPLAKGERDLTDRAQHVFVGEYSSLIARRGHDHDCDLASEYGFYVVSRRIQVITAGIDQLLELRLAHRSPAFS